MLSIFPVSAKTHFRYAWAKNSHNKFGLREDNANELPFWAQNPVPTDGLFYPNPLSRGKFWGDSCKNRRTTRAILTNAINFPCERQHAFFDTHGFLIIEACNEKNYNFYPPQKKPIFQIKKLTKNGQKCSECTKLHLEIKKFLGVTPPDPHHWRSPTGAQRAVGAL